MKWAEMDGKRFEWEAKLGALAFASSREQLCFPPSYLLLGSSSAGSNTSHYSKRNSARPTFPFPFLSSLGDDPLVAREWYLSLQLHHLHYQTRLWLDVDHSHVPLLPREEQVPIVLPSEERASVLDIRRFPQVNYAEGSKQLSRERLEYKRKDLGTL